MCGQQLHWNPSKYNLLKKKKKDRLEFLFSSDLFLQLGKYFSIWLMAVCTNTEPLVPKLEKTKPELDLCQSQSQEELETGGRTRWARPHGNTASLKKKNTAPFLERSIHTEPTQTLQWLCRPVAAVKWQQKQETRTWHGCRTRKPEPGLGRVHTFDWKTGPSTSMDKKDNYRLRISS